MKRIILSLLLTVIAVAGWGQEVTIEIDKIKYVVTGDNTCSVAEFKPGSNEEIDFVVPSSVRSNNNVQYTVEGINEKACFEAMMRGGYVKSVTLPSTLRYIKEGAFAGSLIASIVIPEGVTTLGEYAFAHCPNLRSVTLPLTLTTIEQCDNANFYGPNSTSLAESKFVNNSNLSSNVIAGQLGIVIYQMITDDGLIIDNNCVTQYVGQGGEVNIPEGVTSIKPNVFNRDYEFTSFTIPSTLSEIVAGDSMYGLSTCTNLINNSRISDKQLCEALGIIIIDEKVEGLAIKDNIIVKYLDYREHRNVLIPEGIVGIASSAFEGNPGLESVVIPSTVTYIEDMAFNRCYGLNEVTIKGQNIEFGMGVFDNCRLSKLTFYATVPPTNPFGSSSLPINGLTIYVPYSSVDTYKNAPQWYTFGDNIVADILIPDPALHIISEKKIKYVLIDNENTGWAIGADPDIAGDIVIPGSIRYDNHDYAITTIKGLAFAGTNITSAVVSEGITTILSYAFVACPNLQSITLPSTLHRVTDDITVNYNRVPTTLSSFIHKDKFINHSVTREGTWEVIGFKVYDEKTSDGIMINNHVVVGYIGANEPGLSITIPEGVTKIEPITTWTNMETIVMPESITEISNSAFRFCPMLKNITIKGQNVNIGDYAFWGCSAIQNFTLYATTPPNIYGRNVFSFYINYNNATLYVPYTSVNAYKTANEWTNFKNIVGFVPEGYYLHHYFNCKDVELTGNEYAYLTKDDSEKRYVNGDGHEYGSNGMCKHCGEPLKCAKPTYDAENGLRCKTEGVQYEFKSGYWIATSPEMPTEISLTIIAKKDGYIDSDPLLITISKYDLNNDGTINLNDLNILKSKVLGE